MRTNIDIDDKLLADAMKLAGQKTKRATVEEALKEFVAVRLRLQALDDMKGLGWEGDLDEMREMRHPEWS